MNVAVTLAGHRRSWRAMGAAAVEDWLRTEPWNSSGRPLVVRVAAGEAFAFPAGLRSELRAMGKEDNWPAIDVVASQYCGSDWVAGLAGWMQIQVENRRQLAEAFGRLALHTPYLVVLDLGASASTAAWKENVEALTDLCRKLEVSARVAFIIVATAGELAAGTERLDLGWPVDAVRCHDPQDRWLGYVHERAAWHVAGRLDLAFELEPLLADLRMENELGLEQALDKHAEGCLAKLPPALVQQLAKSIVAVERVPEVQLAPGLEGTDGRGTRVAPWLARALLTLCPDHPARRQLRAAVVCRPIAARLLSRCMDLEQRIVDAVAPKIKPYQPSSEVQNSWTRLTSERDGVENRITPRGCRDPVEPMDLASLGEILTLVGPKDLPKDSAHELRRMRNALAHGSAVGWEAFGILDQIETRLR
jgi:hypothetical protein